MKFSQRIGQTPSVIPLQINDMNIELRNSIWNIVCLYYLKPEVFSDTWRGETLGGIAQLGHLYFFKIPIDKLPRHKYEYISWIREWFFKAEWYECYDYIEWLASYFYHLDHWTPSGIDFSNAQAFKARINKMLDRELSAFRFVGDSISQITNEEEIASIEQALSTEVPNTQISKHIQASLDLLANKTNPDYRNSIKESFSAVEAAAQFVTGDKKVSLGKALNRLEKSKPLHPALKEGFSKLYGWTSDGDGIRHAMQDVSDLELADARFMLVICSAFANYLLSKG